MIKRFKFLILVLVLAFFYSSCQYKVATDTAKLRGKLVNPKSDQILVSDNFFLINSDTLPLVNNNEVQGVVATPKEGLYILFAQPEYQTIYLKPGDSLAFHLNVDDFDESLSFSGNLGFENNLLMELFLANEKESIYFYQHHFNFSVAQFLQKIDSFDREKQSILDGYQSEYRGTTKKFKQIISLLNQSMTMNLKEVYAKKNPHQKLPESYFSYCKMLDKPLADPNVIYMYAFANAFLSRQLSDQHLASQNLYLAIANLINKHFKDPDFKNNLLTSYCYRYIGKKHVVREDTVVKTYFKYLHNPAFKQRCQNLITKNSRLQIGKTFPQITLINDQGEVVNSDELFNNHQVLISFWDLSKPNNFLSNQKKLKALHQQFPNLDFVVININPDNYNDWKLQLPQSNDILFLQATDTRQIENVTPYHLSQIFVLDNQKIMLSMQNMYAPDFSKQLQNIVK
ncbi:MAG TPA: hypothetical protein ENK64_03450 [Flavobacteriales bacterium]|nr:hypothetical protein [Flavobacteriales bacterium]